MLTASLQDTIYSDLLRSMILENTPYTAPGGPFYLVDRNAVPFTPQPTVIRIETDRIGEPIRIEVAQTQSVSTGVDARDNSKIYTVVPTSEVVTVGIQLGRGVNQIAIRHINFPADQAYLILKATTITSLWESFARVLYNVATKIIDEQKRAVSSALATRLVEPFISFQDLLPEIQSLKILSTRLSTKATIHEVGTEQGVNDMVKALSLSNPVYKPMDKDTFNLDPSLDPWVSNASQFGGREAHVWLPNVGVVSWLAFLSFIANQPDLYNILRITEDEVVVEYQGEIQRHRFDFDKFGTDFLTANATEECFRSILVTITMDTDLAFKMCAAAYTFDLFITADNLIGDCRRTLDEGVPFDSSCPFDADPVDPWTDGWEGLSLSGRFEQDYPYTHTLDTFVVPSTSYTGSDCGYEGFYTQQVESNRYDIDLLIPVTVSGFVQASIGWFLQSPDGEIWSVTVNAATQTLIATSGFTNALSNFKVTKPDTSEASFAITNGGVLQVESPPPGGGEILFNTIYILADDATVWHVTVNDSNVIVITKIFPV